MYYIVSIVNKITMQVDLRNVGEVNFYRICWFIPQYREQTVGSLSSATCPPIFMQLTGQNNGGIASSAFLLARKCN